MRHNPLAIAFTALLVGARTVVDDVPVIAPGGPEPGEGVGCRRIKPPPEPPPLAPTPSTSGNRAERRQWARRGWR